jgi:hypothetical protein
MRVRTRTHERNRMLMHSILDSWTFYLARAAWLLPSFLRSAAAERELSEPRPAGLRRHDQPRALSPAYAEWAQAERLLMRHRLHTCLSPGSELAGTSSHAGKLALREQPGPWPGLAWYEGVDAPAPTEPWLEVPLELLPASLLARQRLCMRAGQAQVPVSWLHEVSLEIFTQRALHAPITPADVDVHHQLDRDVRIRSLAARFRAAFRPATPMTGGGRGGGLAERVEHWPICMRQLHQQPHLSFQTRLVYVNCVSRLGVTAPEILRHWKPKYQVRGREPSVPRVPKALPL